MLPERDPIVRRRKLKFRRSPPRVRLTGMRIAVRQKPNDCNCLAIGFPVRIPHGALAPIDLTIGLRELRFDAQVLAGMLLQVML